jgi:hypothetical protein
MLRVEKLVGLPQKPLDSEIVGNIHHLREGDRAKRRKTAHFGLGVHSVFEVKADGARDTITYRQSLSN